MLTRRHMLQGLAASTAMGALPMPARADFPLLDMAPSQAQIGPGDMAPTDLWTFNGSFPGTEIRYTQGDRFQWRALNNLSQPTAVHWHGIRIENAMDGVPGVTQDPIPLGGSFDYDFALPDAGTHWYHSHAQSVEQVERGLYGALIVEEPDAPDVDRDLTLVIDDIRLGRDAQITADFDNLHDRAHAGRIGNVVLTNGAPVARYEVARNSRLRLRIINAANARIFTLGLMGLEGWVMAYDGMPLAEPEKVVDPLTVAPAQRVDLFVDVTAEESEAFLLHFDRTGGYAQASFTVTPGARARRDAPDALPPNPDFPIDLADAMPQRVLIQGGAMRGLPEAQLNGEMLSGRDLAAQGMVWAINGQAGRDATPMLEVGLGQSVRLGMANDSAFPHAMHLHGMHFAEVLPNGGLGPLRDTILLGPDETKEVAFAAHNPGDWLFHCHMLGHHAGGMGSFIRVTA